MVSPFIPINMPWDVAEMMLDEATCCLDCALKDIFNATFRCRHHCTLIKTHVLQLESPFYDNRSEYPRALVGAESLSQNFEYWGPRVFAHILILHEVAHVIDDHLYHVLRIGVCKRVPARAIWADVAHVTMHAFLLDEKCSLRLRNYEL